MFNFFKKKRPVVKSLYILTLTAETMAEDALKPVLAIAEKMLQEKSSAFAKLRASMQEDTPLQIGNQPYNAELHNPQTMQIALDTWLIGQHGVKFEPEFNENFFPHAMRDPQGRENYFLYYFDLEE